MLIKDDFEVDHENHPLFAAAEHVFGSLHGFQKGERAAAAKIYQIDRVTTKLLVYVAEAINLPPLRARRMAASFGCVVKLHALLRALVLDAAIDPIDHKRKRAALGDFTTALKAFSRPAPDPEPVSQDRDAELEALTTVRTVEPAEARDPEAALEAVTTARTLEPSEARDQETALEAVTTARTLVPAEARDPETALEAATTARTLVPGETRDPGAALDSSVQPPQACGTSQSGEDAPQGADGGLAAAEEPDRLDGT
jgi:hypothetical protein